MRIEPPCLEPILGAALWLSANVWADIPLAPEISTHGLADLRYQHADALPGWLDGGLGAFRAGGNTDRLRLNEAAASLHAQLWEWSATLTVKYANRQKNPVDLTEAFLAYRPASASPWRWDVRLGMFFPPISLENTGTAWSSPYTLSSSAINTWVGEELRTFGGEAHAGYRFESGDRITTTAAAFASNDTAGLLLAWRGWALHDYEATLTDRLPLPAGSGIRARFPQQASLSRPFVEVDGRPGYYAGLSAERPELYKLRLLLYDNRADPEALRAGQYGWHTRFWSLGFKLHLPLDFELVSQGMTGSTRMGQKLGGRREVDVDFWAASILLSRAFENHRVSLRHDRFGTGENDFVPSDRNGGRGEAWTANYNITLVQRHQLNFEVSRVIGNRSARASLNQVPHQEETLWQVAYRFFF